MTSKRKQSPNVGTFASFRTHRVIAEADSGTYYELGYNERFFPLKYYGFAYHSNPNKLYFWDKPKTSAPKRPVRSHRGRRVA